MVELTPPLSLRLEIEAARVLDLRHRLRAMHGDFDFQSRCVDALCNTAEHMLSDGPQVKKAITDSSKIDEWFSLSALLESFTHSNFVGLIENENVVGRLGPDLIGHIVSGNMPLVGLTSVVRALLMGSGSLVKMPSSIPHFWFDRFVKVLSFVDHDIAMLISAWSWSRTDEVVTKLFVSLVDTLVVYGDDLTVEYFRSLNRDIPVLGYGHRISAGLVLEKTDINVAAEGLATDILLYDQQGCLSPQSVFVEGNLEYARLFANVLADKLRQCEVVWPGESPERTGSVNAFRRLIAMDSFSEIIATEGLRWTVVLSERLALNPTCTHGCIYVVPGVKEGIIEIITGSSSILQGIALAAGNSKKRKEILDLLEREGVSYVCHPGNLQRPTIDWRQNNQDVLRSLLCV